MWFITKVRSGSAVLVAYMAKFGCSTFLVFRWGERPNERVITVEIGWVLLASATSGFSSEFNPQLGPVFWRGFSGCIKLASCMSCDCILLLSPFLPG